MVNISVFAACTAGKGSQDRFIRVPLFNQLRNIPISPPPENYPLYDNYYCYYIIRILLSPITVNFVFFADPSDTSIYTIAKNLSIKEEPARSPDLSRDRGTKRRSQLPCPKQDDGL